MSMPMWKRVKNRNVLLYWQCEKCNEKTSRNPDVLAINGRPVCGECDKRMAYCYTEVFSIHLAPYLGEDE